jgi:Mrp family chromosome partitioning ATPase
MEGGETKKSEVRRTSEMLQHARANIIGFVYNKLDINNKSSYYYNHYHDVSYPVPRRTNSQPPLLTNGSQPKVSRTDRESAQSGTLDKRGK